MTHDSAVRTVASLLPEIEKKGAEKVLLDYAIREDLPAAQLEKLAQVFNTMRTVAHIEKAADRGSSVDLVDVPILVTDYAVNDHSPVKAAAPRIHVPSHDSSKVDLMSALRREMAEPRLAKAASETEAAKPTSFSREEVLNSSLELQADARLEMSKLAAEILSIAPRDGEGRIDLSGAVTDARHTRDHGWVKSAAEWLKSATRSEVLLGNVSAPLVKRAFHVGTKSADLMERFVDEFVTYTALSKMAGSLNTVLPEEEEGVDTSGLSPEDLADVTQQFAQQAQTDAPAAPATKEEEDPTKTRPEDKSSINPVTPPAKPKSENEKTKSEESEEGGSKGKGGGSKGSKDQDELSVRDILNGVGGAVAAPFSAVGGALTGAAGRANDLLTSITSKERTNRDQQRADVSVEDIRRAINVRRMIGTDPVLRESDPRDVLEIYNAIARQNPEIAQNMTAVKLLLREAVSYEGLTLDAQKQLADIRKSTGESEAKESENTKRRYAVGGSVLPAALGVK
jgi:hypothetical protein